MAVDTVRRPRRRLAGLGAGTLVDIGRTASDEDPTSVAAPSDATELVPDFDDDDASPQAAEAGIFHVEIVIDPVFRALATHA